MPTPTDISLPQSGMVKLDEYGLTVEVSASGVCVLDVAPGGRRSPIMSGATPEDFAKLAALLDSERDRMIREITEDALAGDFRNLSAIKTFGDLHDQCDANIYPSGARSSGRGDELQCWSDEKGDEHVLRLFSAGVIGKGVETVDPEAPFESESYAAFVNATIDAVDKWIVAAGGLAEAVKSAR